MNHNFVFKQIFFRKTACIVFLEKMKDFTEDGGGEKLMAQSQVRDFDTRELNDAIRSTPVQRTQEFVQNIL